MMRGTASSSTAGIASAFVRALVALLSAFVVAFGAAFAGFAAFGLALALVFAFAFAFALVAVFARGLAFERFGALFCRAGVLIFFGFFAAATTS
jgi:hypothetical protein